MDVLVLLNPVHKNSNNRTRARLSITNLIKMIPRQYNLPYEDVQFKTNCYT
jgi:hypothetical protein